MNDKFSIDELMIRVMPGGSLLALIYFVLPAEARIGLNAGPDILFTFLLFCAAFIVGELLQTLAHEFEWIIGLFFKGRRPSKVFLYKNNPVLENEFNRDEVFVLLQSEDEDLQSLDKDYSDLSFFTRKHERSQDKLSQTMFWKLYSRVSDTPEIKTSNRNYLFVRVIIVEFLLAAAALFATGHTFLGAASVAVLLLFVWRGRGVARGLVFKTIILNLRGK